MILFFAIAAIILAIVVLSIRYYMAYAKLTSHKSFDREARRRSKEIQYEDPMITCDYCGARIDTSKDETCPNCGADYSTDKEWIERHQISEEWLDAKAEEVADEEIRKAQQEARRIAKKIKKLIIVLAVILGLLVALALVIKMFDFDTDYTKSEELNEYSFDNYVEVYYQVEDGRIIDTESAKVKVIGIYEDESEYGSDNMKIGYEIENLTGDPIRVKFSGVGVNYHAQPRYTQFHYDNIRKHDKVIVYDRIPKQSQDIKVLSFDEIEVRNAKTEETLFATDEMVCLTTNAADIEYPHLENYSYEFKDGAIKIETATDEYGDRRVSIENGTDYDFSISCDGAKIAGDEGECNSIYKDVVPGHYVFESSTLNVYHKDDYVKMEEGEHLEITLTFECASNPEQNFSTGYFQVK